MADSYVDVGSTGTKSVVLLPSSPFRLHTESTRTEKVVDRPSGLDTEVERRVTGERTRSLQFFRTKPVRVTECAN